MVICSTSPPLPALVSFIFALLLASANAGKLTLHLRLRDPRAVPPTPPSLPPPPAVNHPPVPPPYRPRKHGQPPPPLRRKTKGLNLGKKVGLSFAGIAVIGQFVVVGFLVYKKKQLFTVQD